MPLLLSIKRYFFSFIYLFIRIFSFIVIIIHYTMLPHPNGMMKPLQGSYFVGSNILSSQLLFGGCKVKIKSSIHTFTHKDRIILFALFSLNFISWGFVAQENVLFIYLLLVSIVKLLLFMHLILFFF